MHNQHAGLSQLLATQFITERHEQAALRPPTERRVGEPWHKHPVTSKQETAADAALGRVLARERFSIPDGAPGQVPAPAPP